MSLLRSGYRLGQRPSFWGANGRAQGSRDIHAPRAPLGWTRSTAFEHGLSAEDSAICSGNYVELDVLRAPGGGSLGFLVELGSGPLSGVRTASSRLGDLTLPAVLFTASSAEAVDFGDWFFGVCPSSVALTSSALGPRTAGHSRRPVSFGTWGPSAAEICLA